MPFELGRPLGAPDDPAFQKRVLLASLKLLEATDGPVLEDFPEDEPETEAITVLACPVNFSRDTAEPGESDPLLASFHREMTAMRPWYDMAVSKRQRTTVGVSGIDLEALADFIYAFIKGPEPENPRDDIPLVNTLKLAIEDLKSYYIEGITLQPGQTGASSQVLNNWFWDDTVAGKVLLEVKKACEVSPDKTTRMMGTHSIVPHDVVQRHEKRSS